MPKIESLVAYAIPDIPSKFRKDPSITFRVILLTHRQTDRQTDSGKNITSLAEVMIMITLLCLGFHYGHSPLGLSSSMRTGSVLVNIPHQPSASSISPSISQSFPAAAAATSAVSSQTVTFVCSCQSS